MPGDTSSGLEWLRRRLFDETSQQFRTTWTIYISFYTVFLTFNITALGLTIQYVVTSNRWPIVIAFVLQNINSMVTALRISKFSLHSSERMSSLARELADASNGTTTLEVAPIKCLSDEPIPGRLGYWAGQANAIGHLLLVGCWIAALFIPMVKAAGK